MARRRYSDEFKIEAVKQVLENGYTITDTAERLGVHPTSLSSWIKRYESPEAQIKYNIQQSADAEIKRLQKELKRVTQKRDILKKAAVDSVILHSDQGSQYSSYDYKKLAKKYNITLSMSRRGNCYDNAVAESFFKTLKKELIRKQVFHTREVTASKIFEYIEMFYNSKRRHSYLNYLSPNEFEKRYNLESLKY